jgi:predicted nucleic acid-binding protein
MSALIDSSGWIWAERNPSAAATGDLLTEIEHGTAGTCDPVRLELLRGVSNLRQFDTLDARLSALPDTPVEREAFRLAADIQRALAKRSGSKHRSIPVVDLLIAGAAIAAEQVIIHRDRDFETIAAITHQPLRWLGPR